MTRAGAVAKRMLGLLRRVAIVYLLVVLTMTFIERWLVYPAPSANEGDWSPAHLEYEEVEFAAADGTRLHGWYFDRPGASRVAIYFHGNGEHVAYAADLMPVVARRLDASVLLFDYRGYGKSAGKPHESGVIADGLAASDWLTERTGVAPSDHLLIGRSIGGAVAVAVAEQRGAGCVVVQSTFARMTDVAARLFPWLPVRMLMRNRYPSIDRIQQYEGPVFASHGTHDELAPIEQGRALFEAAPTSAKRFVEVEGMGHNDPLPREYWTELRAFLDALPVDE